MNWSSVGDIWRRPGVLRIRWVFMWAFPIASLWERFTRFARSLSLEWYSFGKGWFFYRLLLVAGLFWVFIFSNLNWYKSKRIKMINPKKIENWTPLDATNTSKIGEIIKTLIVCFIFFRISFGFAFIFFPLLPSLLDSDAVPSVCNMSRNIWIAIRAHC